MTTLKASRARGLQGFSPHGTVCPEGEIKSEKPNQRRNTPRATGRTTARMARISLNRTK